MGLLILEQIITADGYVADPDGQMRFVPSSINDGDQDATQLEMLRDVDAIVLGRKTYQLFVDHWPGVTPDQDPVSEPINALPKHVVTNTLTQAPWGGHAAATVETGDGVRTVQRLTKEYQRNVIVWGSLSLADDLLLAGVVDRLRVRIVPALNGDGRRLTPPSLGLTGITLRSVTPHQAGQVTLEYDAKASP